MGGVIVDHTVFARCSSRTRFSIAFSTVSSLGYGDSNAGRSGTNLSGYYKISTSLSTMKISSCFSVRFSSFLSCFKNRRAGRAFAVTTR
jgi:hypothetical protein